MREILLGGLRARWLEHLLAAAAIAAAVGAAVSIHGLATTAERRVHKLAHDLGNNMLVVPKGMAMADFHALRFGKEGMSDSFPAKIRASDIGRHISSIQALLYGNSEAAGVPLVLVGGKSYSRQRPPSDWAPAGSVLLGRSIAARLGLGERTQLVLGAFRLAVQGVLHRPPNGLDMGAFMSLGVAQNILGREGELNAMRLAGCWCSIDVPALGAKVERLLPGTQAITVAGVLKAQKGTVSIVRRYKAVIPAVAVMIVGAIIVLMTAGQVRRQTREIGLLLAMGAQPGVVVGSIVGRSALVGAVGGALGWLLGVPVSNWLAGHLGGVWGRLVDFSFPQWLAVSISVAAIAAIASLLPAWRAACIEPALVLREK